MSGHSKFSNIKHKKASQDKKKSELFVRLAHQILTSCKQYNTTNIDFNPTLKNLIKTAQKAGMKKERIQNILNRFQAKSENEEKNICFGFYYLNYLFCVYCDYANDSEERIQKIKKSLKNFNISWLGYDVLANIMSASCYCLLNIKDLNQTKKDDLLLKFFDLGISDYYLYFNDYLELIFNLDLFQKFKDYLKIIDQKVEIIYLFNDFCHNIFQTITNENYLETVKVLRILSSNPDVIYTIPNFRLKNKNDLLLFLK